MLHGGVHVRGLVSRRRQRARARAAERRSGAPTPRHRARARSRRLAARDDRRRRPTRARVDLRTAPLALGTPLAPRRADARRRPDRDLRRRRGRGRGARVAGDDRLPAYTGTSAGGFGAGHGAVAGRDRRDRALRHRARRARRSARTHGSARTGRPPVTRTSPPFAPVQTPTRSCTFVTDKGGSSFHCALDGVAARAVPRSEHALTKLAEGPHVLRVEATDRFGLVEADADRAARSTSTRQLPHTIALVRLAADGDRRAVVAMGSDRPGALRVRARRPAGRARRRALPAAFFWPCATPATALTAGVVLPVRAVDATGNSDPIRRAILVPPPGRASRTGARPADVRRRARGGRDRRPGALRGLPRRIECRIDGGLGAVPVRVPPADPARGTPHAAGPPAPGGHEDRRDDDDELAMTVAPSTRATTIVGLQIPLVIERGSALAPARPARAPRAQPPRRPARRDRAGAAGGW